MTDDVAKLTYWLKCNKYDYENYDEELKEKLLILYKTGINSQRYK
jgi:hypothetical protein